MKIEFQGRRVLITGAAGGLGKSIVKAFLETGAIVFALDFNGKQLEILKKNHPTVNTIQADLTDWSATRKALESCLPLDHLVNNAGIIEWEPVLENTENNITRTNALNYTALYNTCQLFAKDAIKNERKGATIVNISSAGTLITAPHMLPYLGSKAAGECLTRNLAVALGPKAIRVNSIAPGAMPTALFETTPDEIKGATAALLERQPIQGLLETEDTAALVLYLSSPFASMITGQVIAIDGGLSIG